MLIEGSPFACPWCGEINQVDLEPGDAGQWVTQDCAVCCSPIEIMHADEPGDEPVRIERGD
jgi:hypothetical protein